MWASEPHHVQRAPQISAVANSSRNGPRAFAPPGADYGTAFVASYLSLTPSRAHYKAARTIRSGRHFMRDDRSVLVHRKPIFRFSRYATFSALSSSVCAFNTAETRSAAMRTPFSAAAPKLNQARQVRQNVEPWTEVRDRLNRILRGWSNYFGYGTRLMAYRAVDQYVYERVRSFLRRRHKVSSRGITTFSDAVVFGKLGVLRLRDVHLGRLP